VSVRLPSGGERRDDDEMLDRISRGEPAEDGDVERMLFTWRASMPSAGPTDDRLLDAVTAAVARPRRDHLRWRGAVAAVAAVAVLTGGALTAVAAQAGPTSPLWPVTELVFGSIAESRVALDRCDNTLDDAKVAADEGRVSEATRLLDHADALADKVDEPGAAGRIRDAIADLRAQLARDAVRTPSRSDATQHHPGPTTTSPATSLTTSSTSSSAPSSTSSHPAPGRPRPSKSKKPAPPVETPFIDAPHSQQPSPSRNSPSAKPPPAGAGR
jgi:hypothetical protein